MTYHNTTAAHHVGDGHYLARGRGRGVGAVPGLVAPVLGGWSLGSDSKKAELKRQKMIAMGLPDPGIPLIVQINGMVANALRPVAAVIRGLPILSDADKTALLSTPIDWFIDVFDPIEDAVGRAVDRVLLQKGNVQNYLGIMRVNLQRVQPIDLKADKSTQNLMKRMRTILAFLVLPMTQPLEFAASLFQEGIHIAGDFFQSLSGYGGGLGVAGGDDAAAAAVATASEAGSTALTAAINTAISTLVSAITASLTTAATNAINTTLNPNVKQIPAGASSASADLQPLPTFPTTTTPVVVQPQVQPQAQSNITTIVIFGGAAALAFLFLRR